MPLQISRREAEVIRRRYGLHGKPGETLRQIGEDLHPSHERMRQIEAEALAKLDCRASSGLPRPLVLRTAAVYAPVLVCVVPGVLTPGRLPRIMRAKTRQGFSLLLIKCIAS